MSTATITIEFDQEVPTDADVHAYLKSCIQNGPGYIRWDLVNESGEVTDAQDTKPPTTWVSKLSVESLFRCVEEDINLLKNGDWIPDDESCDTHAEVVAEIKRRMKTLKCRRCDDCDNMFDDNPGKRLCKTCEDWMVKGK